MIVNSNRNAILDRMQSRIMSIDEFNYEQISAPPLSMLLNQWDIDQLYQICTSLKYSGNSRKKYAAIDSVLKPKGFIKIGGGTNRLCYGFMDDTRYCIKVAYKMVGLEDSPKEFRNQMIFKPFVAKCFEVTPCGTVGLFERVNPIQSREEFISVADDIYELVTKWFIGKHIMADIGTKFFMNYGIRRGFGPVLLDYPYVYELDGNKLYCSAPTDNGEICGGLIDYDDGFNFLYCEKCGLRYRVKELAKQIKDDKIILKGKGGHTKMKVGFKRGDVTVKADEAESLLASAAKSIKTTPKVNPTGRMSVSVSREARDVQPKVAKAEEPKPSFNQRGRVSAATVRGVNPNSNMKSVGTSIEELNAKIERLSAEKAELEAELKKTKDINNDSADDFDQQVRELEERISFLEDQIDAKDKQIQVLNKNAETTKAKDTEATSDTVSTEEYNKLEEELDSSKSQVNTLENDIEELKNEIAIANNKINILENEKNEINSTLAQYKRQVKESEKVANATIKDLEKKLKAAEKATEKAAKADSKPSKEIEQLNFQIDELKEQVNAVKQEKEELITDIRNVAAHVLTKAKFDIESYPAVEGVTDLAGTVENLASIVADGEDRDVVVFYDDELATLSDGDGNVITVSSINGRPINDFMVDSLASVVSDSTYNYYLSDIEDGVVSGDDISEA